MIANKHLFLVTATVLAPFAQETRSQSMNPPGPAQIIFTDANAEAGITTQGFDSTSGHTHGVAFVDLNKDGWDDIMATNGGLLSLKTEVYLNNGDGTFSHRNDLLPFIPTNYEMSGLCFADYDNDGDSDVYIFTDTDQFELWDPNEPDGFPNVLMKNNFVENGNVVSAPLFEVVDEFGGDVEDLADPPLGVKRGMRAMTGGWIDYDRDGWVDLYCGHMLLQDATHLGNQDRLYRNMGDGTFMDVTASVLPHASNTEYYRPALAFLPGHFDDDLWPDMYVVNVHEPDPYHYDILYKNNGDGTFSDVTGLSPGLGDDSGSGMGIDIADIDLDGDWDIYISDVLFPQNQDGHEGDIGNPLYLGNGDGTWQDNVAEASGVTAAASWGVNFLDVDNDCYEDLFVGTTGNIPPFLYHNNHDATFADISAAAGFTATGNLRGTAVADYDQDGDPDLVVIDNGGTMHLYRNDTLNSGHSLQVRLQGTKSNFDCIGAIVEVDVGSLTMKRQIEGASSAHSQDSTMLHFGTGPALKVDQVRVYFPSGAMSVFNDVATDQILNIKENRAFLPGK